MLRGNILSVQLGVVKIHCLDGNSLPVIAEALGVVYSIAVTTYELGLRFDVLVIANYTHASGAVFCVGVWALINYLFVHLSNIFSFLFRVNLGYRSLRSRI